MTTNELQLAKAFRDAGIEQPKAETLATTIFDAIRDNVATKSDLRVLEQTLRGEIQTLKLWIGGIAFVTASALFTALHYWPPHP